jgi:hypothetical protein
VHGDPPSTVAALESQREGRRCCRSVTVVYFHGRAVRIGSPRTNHVGRRSRSRSRSMKCQIRDFISARSAFASFVRPYVPDPTQHRACCAETRDDFAVRRLRLRLESEIWIWIWIWIWGERPRPSLSHLFPVRYGTRAPHGGLEPHPVSHPRAYAWFLSAGRYVAILRQPASQPRVRHPLVQVFVIRTHQRKCARHPMLSRAFLPLRAPPGLRWGPPGGTPARERTHQSGFLLSKNFRQRRALLTFWPSGSCTTLGDIFVRSRCCPGTKS